MVFEPGLAGGSRYIVIDRRDDRFTAVGHVSAPGTPAPPLFQPGRGAWGAGEPALPAEFAVRLTDRAGREFWVAGRDPTGAVVEVPARAGAGASHRLVRPSAAGGTVRFRLQLPRRVALVRIEIFSAACSGIFGHRPPRPFPVDISGLPPPRPPAPGGQRIFDPRIHIGIGAPPATTICLVGDGYRSCEQQLFTDKCAAVVAAVAALGLPKAIAFEPVFRPSTDSGTDFTANCSGGAEVTKTTAYDSGYGYAVAGDCDVLAGDAKNAWTDQESVGAKFFIGIVNASVYGGSSWGDSAWFPANNPQFIDLFLHEMGHMLGLRDEYDTLLAGHFTNVQSYSNVTTDPVNPPWGGSKRIFRNTTCAAQSGYLPAGIATKGEVAAFQGASYDPCQNYRPCATCKMRDAASPFCSMCRELMGEYLDILAATPP